MDPSNPGELPACFKCHYHSDTPRASNRARQAFAILCQISGWLEKRCTVVWEARPEDGLGPFDFWLHELRVVVEVDGAQHTEGRYKSVEAWEQRLRDDAKDAAATAKGYHVVRLHVYDDTSEWHKAIRAAVFGALRGDAATVHRTPYYAPTATLGEPPRTRNVLCV